MQGDVETGSVHPLRYRFGGKSQAAVGVLLAQEFQVVRREIDHQQPAARRQHTRCLADRARAVVEEVQHLMDDDDVERACRHREIVDVALAHAAMAQARTLDARARQQQHVERKVDAETALQVRAEHFQDTPGAGAEIEQRTNRPIGQCIADRGFDCLVGDVQLADAIPLRGVRAEVILRCGRSRGPDGSEPVTVARDH